MKQSPGRQNTPRPYWESKSDTVYSELAFGFEWLASVWFEHARSVPDHWDPSLGEREQAAYYKAFWQQLPCRGVTS